MGVVSFSWNCWLSSDIIVFLGWRLVNISLGRWLIYLGFGWWLLGFHWLNWGFLDLLSDRGLGFWWYDTDVCYWFLFLFFLSWDLSGIGFDFWIFLSFLSIINIVFLFNWLHCLSNNWLNWLCRSWFLRLNNVCLRFGLDDLLWSLLFCWSWFDLWLLVCWDTWPLINDRLDSRFNNLRVILRRVASWLPFGRWLINVSRLLLFLIGCCDVVSWRLCWGLDFRFWLSHINWSPWGLIFIDRFVRLFSLLLDHRSRGYWLRLLFFHNNWFRSSNGDHFLGWLFLYLVR